ncbi:MAG: ORF6C domain-containing protein [Peptococcaceae bacterium]|nr:ORF6C domain-containing protein [Peptococcaceae bacterium]
MSGNELSPEITALVESTMSKIMGVYAEEAQKSVRVLLQEFAPILKEYQVYKTTYPLRELEDDVRRAVKDRVQREINGRPSLRGEKNRLYALLNNAIHKEFMVKRRHWIPQKLYREVLDFIDNYVFPAAVSGKERLKLVK